MDTLDTERRIARAVHYMETHLGRAFPLEEAAAEACWSLFHFHRMFTACMGLGPGEYLRRRRLARAAEALALGGETVRSIAAHTGFTTAESFGRAFRQAFGLSPLAYRQASAGMRRLNPFGPVARATFERPPGLVEDPGSETRGTTKLAVLHFTCPLESTEMGPRITAFWKGPAQRLLAWPGRVPGISYGLALPDEVRPGGCIRYLAGVELQAGSVAPAWAEAFEIPEGSYLRAVAHGDPAGIKDIWLYLYGYWLPRHGMEPGRELDFDLFRTTEPSTMELFLPLKDRKE